MRTRHSAVVALLFSLGLASGAFAQRPPEFIGLGSLPGAVPGSVAFGISADGETVVGSCAGGATCSEAWRWTRADGMTSLGVLAGETTSGAVDASADGTVIVGASGAKAFRWTSGGGMVDLGIAFGGDATSSAVSGDGETIVGNHFDSGTLQGGSWRWTSGGGAVQLQSFDATLGDVGAFADVSADGVTLVGFDGLFDDTDPFYWTQSGGFTSLPELPWGGWCQCGSLPNAISDDGLTIVGRSHESAFRWSAANGIETVGASPTEDQFYEASAVSGDGSVIAGTLADDTETTLFVWSEASGRIELTAALANLGVPATGWDLLSANAISEDGKVIVGDGVNPSGRREAWLAVLPRIATSPQAPALGPAALWMLAALLGGYGLINARRSRTQ